MTQISTTGLPHPADTIQKLDAIVNEIIFQAGCDDHGHPLLVICASRFPAPSKYPPGTHFSMLVNHALSIFSPQTCAGPYSLIIFASPSPHGPNIKQVLSSYLRLHKSTRKNLKTLWVVHPSFWAKMTLQVFLNGIVSWKVGRKVKRINNLSELANQVPIHQICIPPEVYKVDLAIEPSITVPSIRKPKPVLGIPLEELMGERGERGIPQLVQDSVNCIRSTGLNAEGLFRRPPSLTTLRVLSEAYDRGHPVKIPDYPDAPYLAASLLKLFLRQLPTPIFAPSLYPVITACPPIQFSSPMLTCDSSSIHVPNPDAVSYIRDVLLKRLSPPAIKLLAHVLCLAHDIALRAAENKMDAHNMATCLAPTLLRSDDVAEDAAMCKLALAGIHNPPATSSLFTISGTSFGLVLKLMITNFTEIFTGLLDRSSPDQGDSSHFFSAPTSPTTSSSASSASPTSYQDFPTSLLLPSPPITTTASGTGRFITSSKLHELDRRASYSVLQPSTTNQTRPTSTNSSTVIASGGGHNRVMSHKDFSFASHRSSQHHLVFPPFGSVNFDSSGLGLGPGGSLIATTEVDGTNATGRVGVRDVFADVD